MDSKARKRWWVWGLAKEDAAVSKIFYAGLTAGIRYARQIGMEHRQAEQSELLTHLWKRLGEIPGVTRYGPGNPAHQLAVVSFTVDGSDPGRIAHELDRGGVCCRSGLHCAPRAHRTLGTFDAGGTVRFGLSGYNTHEEIDEVVELLKGMVSD